MRLWFAFAAAFALELGLGLALALALGRPRAGCEDRVGGRVRRLRDWG